jgi:hypothetical protein
LDCSHQPWGLHAHIPFLIFQTFHPTPQKIKKASVLKDESCSFAVPPLFAIKLMALSMPRPTSRLRYIGLTRAGLLMFIKQLRTNFFGILPGDIRGSAFSEGFQPVALPLCWSAFFLTPPG